MTVLNKSTLPVEDALLLNEYDGREIEFELPEYKLETDGTDYKSRVAKLFENGYLAYGTPKDNLNYLTIAELKEILRANGQKVGGKKEELVNRVAENVPLEKYAERIPRIYKVTEKGRREIENRSSYTENQKMQYGFLNLEIAATEKRLEREGRLTPDEVLEELFVVRITKYGGAQEYGLLRNTYYNLAQYFKLRKRFEESLRSLLSVIYYDLSGMCNGNYVEDYQNLGWAFETSVWKEIDKLRTGLNLTDEGLKALFDEALETSVKAPFTYFDTETMKAIILDRLNGESDIFQKYRSVSQSPPRETYDEPIKYSEPPKSKSKMLLAVASIVVCLTVGAVFIGGNNSSTNAANKSAVQTVAVRQENDALQNLFLKVSLNTTEAELQSYIAAGKLEYTAQDTAPKQMAYKIGYRKGDTYHTRSTGGDYIEVSFNTKTGKVLGATYFNAETSTQAMMTDAPFHGHKNDGRSSYYYFYDGTNFKVIDGAAATFEDKLVDCYSAEDALSRVKAKLA